MSIYKIGDRVKVISNESLGRADGGRLLIPGDIVTIDSFYGRECINYYYVTKEGTQSINSLAFSDIELYNETESSMKCSCEIISLLNNGCKCGAIDRERLYQYN